LQTVCEGLPVAQQCLAINISFTLQKIFVIALLTIDDHRSDDTPCSKITDLAKML